MKRNLILLFLVLVVMVNVLAVEEPTVEKTFGMSDSGKEDVEKIQGVVEDLPIDPRTGKIDFDKYKPFGTKADERIKAINLWLETNASWLKVVFGMVPSFTWLFGINLWIWLFFLVFLVLNADITFGQLPFFGESRIDVTFFETSWAQVFGLFVFVVVVTLKWIVNLANLAHGLLDVVWNILLPLGFALAVIAAILIVVGCGFSIPLAMRIAETIRAGIIARKKKREEAKEAVNREALDKIVQGATQEYRQY